MVTLTSRSFFAAAWAGEHVLYFFPKGFLWFSCRAAQQYIYFFSVILVNIKKECSKCYLHLYLHKNVL